MVIGKYEHYKGGIYYLIGSAEHTETNEKLVVYLDQNGKTWVRPKEMFFGKVKFGDLVKPRFKLISLGEGVSE
jgi:hypothetical protein